jgi:hypothetical protein
MPNTSEKPQSWGEKFIRAVLPNGPEFDDPKHWSKAAQAVDMLRAQVECGWTIIANAGAGDWDLEKPEWRDAAAIYRDAFKAMLRADPSAFRRQLDSPTEAQPASHENPPR